MNCRKVENKGIGTKIALHLNRFANIYLLRIFRTIGKQVGHIYPGLRIFLLKQMPHVGSDKPAATEYHKRIKHQLPKFLPYAGKSLRNHMMHVKILVHP